MKCSTTGWGVKHSDEGVQIAKAAGRKVLVFEPRTQKLRAAKRLMLNDRARPNDYWKRNWQGANTASNTDGRFGAEDRVLSLPLNHWKSNRTGSGRAC